jgi:type II secretory pathway pseudopilin PulG
MTPLNLLGGLKLALPARARRAMTLVEVTIVAGLLVIVLGMAMEVELSSSRATDAIGGRQRALAACQRAQVLVAKALQEAVAPSDLTGASAPKAAPVFKRRHVTVYSLDAGETGPLDRLDIGAEAGDRATSSSAGAAVPCLLTHCVVNAAAGKQNDIQPVLGNASEPVFGSNDIPGYRLELSFAYAKASDPGQEPAWRDDWPAGQWPDLALVRARAVPRVAGGRAVELVTAVIPGGVHGAPASGPTAGKEAKP